MHEEVPLKYYDIADEYSTESAEPTRQAEISYAVFCLKKKNTEEFLWCILLQSIEAGTV